MEILRIIILYFCFIYSFSFNQINSETSSNLDNTYNKINEEPILKLSEEQNNNIIEIESGYIISQISWTKKDVNIYNYLLGVFEGANDPSFSDAIPIAMIKDGEITNKINYIKVNTTNAYKYIRYIPPNINKTDIHPLKIFLSKSKGDSNIINEETNYQPTNLPLISINSANFSDPKDDKKDVECQILLINGGKIEINETGKIKIRGRSTAFISPKKPYRIKFSTKQKILNFKGEYKKWTLISNSFDRALLRNDIAFKISELMEFEYTPRCTPVDVILNGIYRGNYYICDKMEIGEDRINLDKIEKTDISGSNISGGYFIEIDGRDDSEKHYKTQNGIVFKINEPEEDKITLEQKNYIISKINKFENEIYNGVLDSIDLESFSKFFLLEEFSGDYDCIYSSLYIYKKRNDDKFYFGPVWDFDLAFENDRRLIPTNEKNDFVFNYVVSSGTMKNFMKTLTENKNVIEYIKNTWQKLCDTVLNVTILYDFIEEKRKLLKESAELNHIKWDYYGEDLPWNIDFRDLTFGRKGESFDFSVDVIKGYIGLRFGSLSNIINNKVKS